LKKHSVRGGGDDYLQMGCLKGKKEKLKRNLIQKGGGVQNSTLRFFSGRRKGEWAKAGGIRRNWWEVLEGY